MPNKTRQFKGTSKPKEHYDRKVRKVGYTIYVALGKVIPEGWDYIRITPLNRTPNTIEVLFEKLLGSQNNAQTKTNNTADKQDA